MIAELAPVCKRTFDVGDLVYIHNSGTILGQSKKLLPIWKGPFVVTKAVSRFLCRIVGHNIMTSLGYVRTVISLYE